MTSSRRGFMYSIFAVFILGVTVVIVSNPVATDMISTRSESSHVDEAFYFLSSIEQDIERTGQITARRTFTAAVNHVATEGIPLDDGGDAIRSGFRNGTINGTEQVLLNDTSYEDWSQVMINRSQDAGFDLTMNMTQVGTTAQEPIHAQINATFNLSLFDDVTTTGFDRQVSHTYTVSMVNITDPLPLLETNGQYATEFHACGPETHVEQVGSGDDYRYQTSENWTSARSVIRPENGGVTGITDKAQKAAVVADICAYTESTIEDELSQFNGVISDANRSISEDTICGGANISDFNAYIGGVSSATTALENGTMTVMDEQDTWQNNIIDEIDNACYFSDRNGPEILERLEGELFVSGDGIGWASFVDVPSLPSDFQDTDRSAVDYVYFNESSTFGPNEKIKGVSDHRSWFRLDKKHVDRWNMNDLVYE